MISHVCKKSNSRSILMKRLMTASVLSILLCIVVLQSACLSDWIELTLPSVFNPSSTAATTDSSGTSASDAQTTGPTLAPGTFEARVEQIILTGLQARQKSINIDAAFEPLAISKDEIQTTIDKVYAVYQKIFCEHPEFFYLNGSINVSYSSEGIWGTLASMTIKPDYWQAFTSLSTSALDSRIAAVNDKVEAIAKSIRKESSVPWQQLQLAHDYLIQNIVYDSSLNQQVNQAYSALIEKSTLCQGYAQSFQLIAQRLGFETVMALGESEGVGHAWNIVKFDGSYYQVDVTFDDPTPDAGSGEPVQHVYLFRSDSQMALNHTWVKTDYPACPVDGNQYFVQQGLVVNSQAALKSKLNKFVESINYNVVKTNRLELLFTGTDVPSSTKLEDMIRAAMQAGAAGNSVLFSHQINTSIIIVDVVPDN